MGFVVLSPLDAPGNLSRLKAVRINGTNVDLTKFSSTPNLYQFVAGHKAKNPAYSSAEQTYILNWIKQP